MKIKLIFLIILISIMSCNNKTETESNSEKEKQLLEKELELTKRELQIERNKKETTNKVTALKRKNPEFSFAEPEQIVEAIIYAAKNKDFEILYNLCDPQEKGDVTSLCVCKLSSEYKSNYAESQNCDDMTRQIFITLFKNAKNPTTIANDGLYATVEYQVENLDVTMEMVKRKDRWFIFTLSSPEP